MGEKRRTGAGRAEGRLSSNEGSSTTGRRDRRKERVKEGRIIKTDVNRKNGGGATPLCFPLTRLSAIIKQNTNSRRVEVGARLIRYSIRLRFFFLLCKHRTFDWLAPLVHGYFALVCSNAIKRFQLRSRGRARWGASETERGRE